MKLFKTHKLIIFFLILLLAWSIIHELVHGAAIVLSGHNVEFGYQILYGTATCIDCVNTPISSYALFAVAPYVIDIAMLLTYCFYKNRALFWLSFVAFVDVIVNYFAMVVWLFDKNAAIDFIIIDIADYAWLPLVIGIAAVGLWAYGNREMLMKVMKK